MTAVLTAFHVLICFGLIVVVLLQTGKGTGMASVFGGGGGGSLMGGKGFGGILAKATAGLAIAFMLTSITLSLIPRAGWASRTPRPAQQVPSGQTQQRFPDEPLPDEQPADETPAGAEESAPVAPPEDAPSEAPTGE